MPGKLDLDLLAEVRKVDKLIGLVRLGVPMGQEHLLMVLRFLSGLRPRQQLDQFL